MLRSTYWYFFITPVFLSLAFISCRNHAHKGNEKTVFRYNESAGISSLDPAYARDLANIWAVNQLYNGLVQMNDKLEVEPCIAKKWEVSRDGLVYTFHLRTDVFFHDDSVFEGGKGRRVVAQDFVNSFFRITDPRVASPGAWIFNNVSKSVKYNFLGFDAVNDSTFQVFLDKPFPPFLGLLTMQYCSVVPSEAAEYYGKDFRNHPVGTGPFKFKLWKEGTRLIFVKNENYFERDTSGQALPYLDAVSISFTTDKQIAFLDFIQGRLDFLSGIDGSYKDELLTKFGRLQPKYEKKIKMETLPYLNTEYLGILMDDNVELARTSPLRLKAVRQAVSYGFDRQKMITYMRNNIGMPGTSGFVPYGLPSFDAAKVTGYNYNPDMARKLLKQAGFPEGKGLAPITLNTIPPYLDFCEYIQSQLAEIGITVRIEVNQWATHKVMMARSQMGFFRHSWVADYPDAENYLALFYSRNFSPSGPNYTHFSSAEFDRLYERARTEENEEKRYILYRQMDQIIMNEAPIVVLYYDRVVRLFQNNISGLGNNAMNLLTLKRVKKINTRRTEES